MLLFSTVEVDLIGSRSFVLYEK